MAFGLDVTLVVNEGQHEKSLDPLVEDISDTKGVFVALGFAVIKTKWNWEILQKTGWGNG